MNWKFVLFSIQVPTTIYINSFFRAWNVDRVNSALNRKQKQEQVKTVTIKQYIHGDQVEWISQQKTIRP